MKLRLREQFAIGNGDTRSSKRTRGGVYLALSRSSDRHPHLSATRRLSRMRRGSTLVEALVAALLSLFVGSALLMLIQSTMTARTTVQDGSASMRDTRDCLDALENNIRNAQMAGALGVFSTATINSITCYTNTAGTTTSRFWLDTTTTPYSFKQTVSGVTTLLLTDVQSIAFTYYVNSSTNYTSATTWATSTNANAPTAAEIPNLGAVAISVTVTSGGVSRTLTTLVRLRNSPNKPHI